MSQQVENLVNMLDGYVEKGGHGSSLTSISRSILQEYFNVGTVSDVTTFENKLS